MSAAEITARILADSITDGGSRLVTWEWTYPRAIHAEIMTHRALSRNLASSRAIPAAKLRANIVDRPYVPLVWGANQKGMQAEVEVADTKGAESWWIRGRDLMAAHHAEGEALGLHKQVVNRVIEPWMMAVGIVTMTDHANLFHLRRHKDAEPHFQRLANLAWEAFHEHMPTYRAPGEWHLPFITPSDRPDALDMAMDQCITDSAINDGLGLTTGLVRLDGGPNELSKQVKDSLRIQNEILRKVSTGRCARVSYMTHEGKRDLAEDVTLHDRLAVSGHWSPFEHPAMAVGGRARHKNCEGWRPYRCEFEHESGPDTSDRCEKCGCWGGRHVTGCPNTGEVA